MRTYRSLEYQILYTMENNEVIEHLKSRVSWGSWKAPEHVYRIMNAWAEKCSDVKVKEKTF